MSKKEKEEREKKEISNSQNQDIVDELRDSYLDYAMSVIVSRALPDSRDGLKPVQRRILFAMRELGLSSAGRFRKSATVVGECFVKDTMVLTQKGLMPIQKIEIGDTVFTQNGLHKVIKLYRMPERPLLEIEMENGISNTVTPSQKFKVLTESWDFQWKEAKELTPDDYLITRAVYPQIDSLRELKRTKENQPIFLNENIAYFLGMFVSEGSLAKDYSQKKLPRIIISNNDFEIMKRIAVILEQEFGYKAAIETKNYQLTNKKGEILRNTKYIVRINKKDINDFFVMNFGLEGKKTLNKEIPQQIFASPEKIRFAFISGLIDGDGSIHKNREVIHYGSISEELIDQLQVFLQHQGIFSQKYGDNEPKSHYVNNRQVVKRFPFYYLEIGGENAIKLALKLELVGQIKKGRVLKLRNKAIADWERKGPNKNDLMPYAGRMIFQELSNNYLGSGWYQNANGDKFRLGIKYPNGESKIRYSLGLWEKPLSKTQVIERGIKNKLEKINSPSSEFLDDIIKNKIYFLKISSVKKVAPKKTYDLEIENEHEFIANGLIAHNCLGKYHPHSDIAVYDALVRMAQDFSLRYPLVQGQGNFGSVDGDPPAAMRYTEIKFTPLAEEMLEDLEKETVDFTPNYDGTKEEPKYLPAKLPQLILNGSMGIAVGMATNIPPHNLKEVADAITHLIDDPHCSVKDLMRYIKGPDFPTGGIILGQENILEAYASGKGKIICRAKTEVIEEEKNNKIIITEIPYQVNKAELIITIAKLVEEKRIEGIKDLRDESDRDGLRIVIDLKNETIPRKVLNQLLKFTDLEKNFHINILALTEKGLQPQLLSLKDVLSEYLKHRQDAIRRRTEFLLRKARERAHILEGLAKALNHIDEIIKLIRASDDKEDAQRKLIAKYSFTETQVNAILEMKLQSLAKLERKKIEEELLEKQKLIKEYGLILEGPKKIFEIIKKELEELKNKYGDERRTEIQDKLPESIAEDDLIPEKETLITLSQNGYIKRMDPSVFRGQKRGGKGIIGYEGQDGEDFLIKILYANTKDDLFFFTDKGRMFKLKTFEIGEASRVAKGKTIQNYLTLNPQEKVVSILKCSPEKERTSYKYLVIATAGGIIKKSSLEEYNNIRKGGIIAIKLVKNDSLIGADLTSGSDEIILITNNGQAIRFAEKEVRAMGRSASGVTGMKISSEDKVVSLVVVSGENSKEKSQIFAISENGFGKKTGLKEYRKQKRGGHGIRTMKITGKTGHLIKASLIREEEFLIAISQKGQTIKSSLSAVPSLKRGTQGVRIMKLNADDKIGDVALF